MNMVRTKNTSLFHSSIDSSGRFGLRKWAGLLICIFVFVLPAFVAASSEKVASHAQQSGESEPDTKEKKNNDSHRGGS